MSNKTLDEIRKKLQALDNNRRGGGNYTGGSKTVYPHWDIPEGTQSIVRFAPDKNEDNTFFWTERQTIKLPFPGIKGHDEGKAVIVEVPCIEMWNGKNTCPILNEVRPMWKDASLEDTARKYWVKRTYFAQGFVESDPMGEKEVPENPIRKFIIGPQIFAIMKSALMDPDMTYNPVDYINGTNFIIKKTSKGGFADYGTSAWARRESSLTEDQLAAIANPEFGLVDLNVYLPRRPTPAQLAGMFDMFESSLNGDLYDPAKFAQFYKPWGFDSAETSDNGTTTSVPTTHAPANTPVSAKVEIAEDDIPFDNGIKSDESASNPAPAKSPQEILKMLRERNTK